jgi:hypothetical protein
MSVVFHVVCTIDQAVTVDNKHHGANKATLPSFWIRSLQLQSDISCNSPPSEYFSKRTVQHKHCTAPPLADRCGLFYSPYSCSSPAASPHQSLRWVRSTTSKSISKQQPPCATDIDPLRDCDLPTCNCGFCAGALRYSMHYHSKTCIKSFHSLTNGDW